jgi:hypothetical protein
VPNFNVFFSFFLPLIVSHQRQNRLHRLDHRRKILYQRTNTLPSSLHSHPLLSSGSSPSPLLSPLSTFGHQRSSLAAARQLYAFIDNSILSVLLHFANKFLTFLFTFFYTLGAALMRILITLADSGLSVGRSMYSRSAGHRVQFEVRSPFVSRLLCDSHSSPCVCAFCPLCDYLLVTVEPLSTRPLSPLVLSFISPLSFSLDDVPSPHPSLPRADADKILVTSLRHGMLMRLKSET